MIRSQLLATLALVLVSPVSWTQFAAPLPGGLTSEDWTAIRGAHRPSIVAFAAQEAYVKASNTDAFDWFGSAVAASGDTVVVGAPGEDSNASGVNGDQSDDSALSTGAVYVFVRSGGGWVQQAYLKASNPDASDAFGVAVAVSGDTVVVGGPGEDSDATGVNGDEGDNSSPESGAAYVFVRQGTTWHQQAYLKASDTDPHDSFGASVAVSGDRIVVGAALNDLSTGSAYVFARNGSAWTEEGILLASNQETLDRFGWSVGISGDTAVIGAPLESSATTGVGGDESNNNAPWAGAAYVFVRSGTAWHQQAYLKASNTDHHDRFGRSVAIAGDTVVIAAKKESGAAPGVNGDQSSNDAPEAGAAYVFRRAGTSWSQEAYLKASNPEAADEFGTSVSIADEVVVIGASEEDSDAVGVNGSQGNGAAESGAAYVFLRAGQNWIQVAYLKSSNSDSGDSFGWATAVTGGTIVITGPGEDSGTIGINGDQLDNTVQHAGAAYLFALDIPYASCQSYCGSGVNLNTYVVNTGFVLGSTFQGTVALTPPNVAAVVAGYLGRKTFPLWGQEGLVDPATPEVMNLPLGLLPSPITLTWLVPRDPAYIDMHVYTQAAAIGGGVINLTCAYDCTAGY